ncbi:MAG: lipid-A-disaccharide synthase [Thaumarchaeota archaeon]|nr:MAG: lipid-A-disaccharide synthase [Nitrososphaerota archaeon]
MKIWFDILTPKQLLFFEPIIQRLKKNHTVLCTSRKYNQVTDLAKIRKQKLVIIGKYGGVKKHDKLDASLSRSKLLVRKISKFLPDITLSSCSPEAARVSYGLGIPHICFSDSPHATAVMKLSLPYANKLLIPWIIPKSDFKNMGIKPKNIIQYKTIDAAQITKQKVFLSCGTDINSREWKTILIRTPEEEAAYSSKQSDIVGIIKKIKKDFLGCHITVLTRYEKQAELLKKKFSKSAQSKFQIVSKVVDGKKLLLDSDVFVGSGGTMTAESALLGVPTISYNAIPNRIEDYLVSKKIVTRCMTPNKVAERITHVFQLTSYRGGGHERTRRLQIKKFVNSLEDPYPILLKTMKSVMK